MARMESHRIGVIGVLLTCVFGFSASTALTSNEAGDRVLWGLAILSGLLLLAIAGEWVVAHRRNLQTDATNTETERPSITMDKFYELQEATRPAPVRFDVDATPHVIEESNGRYIAALAVTNISDQGWFSVHVTAITPVREPREFAPFEGRWELTGDVELALASGEGPKIVRLRRLIPKLDGFQIASEEGPPVWWSVSRDPVRLSLEVRRTDAAAPPIEYEFRLGFDYPSDPEAGMREARPRFELWDR